MTNIGSISPRTAAKIQIIFCVYFGSLFAGFLAALPNKPFTGGDPFEKFGWSPVNWPLMYQTAGMVAYLAIITAFVAYKGDDHACMILCQAYACNWFLCGSIYAYQVHTGVAKFTEVNVLCYILVPYYYRLGFMGTPAKKGASPSLKVAEPPPPAPASAKRRTRSPRAPSKSPSRR